MNISDILHKLIVVFNTLSIDDFVDRFDEPWRAYHNGDHIIELYSKLEEYKEIVSHDDKTKISKKDYYKMLCLIIFHDVIYYPWKTDNELESAEFFKLKSKQIDEDYKDIIDWVYNGIIATKEHKKTDDFYLNMFLEWDMSILKSDPYKLLKYENQIQKEYSFVDTSTYKQHRLEFLKNNNEDYPNLKMLENYLENDYKPKVGFYAGSFNPFHIGHLSIVEQAKKVYDKVVIIIAQNPDKPSLTNEEIEKRKKQIFSACPGIEIQYVTGFVPMYLIDRSEEEEVFLIRGIRNTMDWMAESNYLQYCLRIDSSLQVQYFTCPKHIEHVSSSGIRAMEKIEEGSANNYLPKNLLKNEN